MKIFGIGLPRTGTVTLKSALIEMGFTRGGANKFHDPDAEVFVGDYMNLPRGRYEDLDRLFPDAKFILTERKDATAWYDSVVHRLDRFGDSFKANVADQRERMYGSAVPIKPLYMRRYYEHSRSVLEYFISQYGNEAGKKLLLVCWDKGDGWEKLAKFLDHHYPDIPFPHKNKSK